MWLVICIIIIILVISLGPTNPVSRYTPCRGHKWTEVEQPGIEDDEGRPTVYLYCIKCKKTAQEVLMDE